MELLQELMGTTVEEKDKPKVNGRHPTHWQPATRRSIKRWLTELEQAGWLVWTRREETSRRYHLRTSARSAFDSAVLHEIRTLLNSGKATLVEVQALLRLTPGTSGDTTTGSHDSIPGSHQDALAGFPATADATSESHSVAGPPLAATAESHCATEGSYRATSESHGTTEGSHGATEESHHASEGSHGGLGEGVQMPQNEPPYKEISQNKIQEILHHHPLPRVVIVVGRLPPSDFCCGRALAHERRTSFGSSTSGPCKPTLSVGEVEVWHERRNEKRLGSGGLRPAHGQENLGADVDHFHRACQF